MAGSHHEIAPEVHNGVSTLDEPSAAWGWHHIGQNAVQIAGWISVFEPKGTQARTLTAHNKPIGHVEPDWTYLQATCTGPYAELTDKELRALNIEPSRVAHLRSLEK